MDEILSNSNYLISTLSSHELLITQMSSQVFSLILPAWIYSKLDSDSTSLLNRNYFSYDIFFLTLVFFISSIPLVAFSAYLNQFLPLTDWMTTTESHMSEMIEKMLNFHSLSDLVIAIIVIAVIPAIGEEWVFRGILQNQIILWTKNKWVGLILASVFFSAIHMQFQGFLPRCLLGLILGFVYLNTGNLWHSILLHFFNNGFQVIGAYIYKEEILKQLKNEAEMPNGFALAFSILAVAITGYYLIQKTKEMQHA